MRIIYRNVATVFVVATTAMASGHSVSAAALLDVQQKNSKVIQAHELFAPVPKPVSLNANQTLVYLDIHLTDHDGDNLISTPK